MANKETKLKFKVGIEGVDKLRGLTSSLKRLNDNTLLADKSGKKLLLNLKNQRKTATQNISGTKTLANSYRQLANSVKIGSREFKIATARAEQLERKLRKLNTTTRKGSGIRGMAKTAGAIAGAGIFGGAEGAIGAGIGGIVGGAPGALVGGAIGAQVGQFTQGLSELASFSAQLKLQRKALELVVADTKEFTKAQQFLGKTSKQLAIPQEIITRQFTSLTASVLGAGLSVDDAQTAFEAIAAGIRGTGGSLEDMKAAMRATSQVFSKGKVSAEELRQQLGERLPGAFTLFAESMDLTPQMLDKALEQGKVTLEDFMGFANHLFDKYGENAKILADSPAAAGDRLSTEMSILKDNVGQLLAPIGAEFQTVFAGIVRSINPAIEAFVNFKNKLEIQGVEDRIKEIEADLKRGFRDIGGTLGSGYLGGGLPIQIEQDEKTELQNELRILKDKLDVLKGIKKETKDIDGANNNLGSNGTSVFESLKNGATSYLESIKDVSKQIQDATVNAFKGMEDALVNFVMTGKMNFADFARSIIADITRIAIRQAIIAPILGAIFPSFGVTKTTTGTGEVTMASFNAKGNVYDKGLKKFAKGGIVSSPTIFAYGSGGYGNFGLMGEAGSPEAILPLKRGRSGNLGVEASGGATNIVVNVDASGSSVEGSEQGGKELGRVISVAIQSELIKQKRPGGLLA